MRIFKFFKHTFLFVNLFVALNVLAAPPEPAHNGQKNVTDTIVISKAGTYDFGSVLHVWKGKSWDCLGDKENGPQILRIEADNVTIKNFHYVGDGKTKGSKGLGDPIHITSCGTGMGNNCKARGPKNIVIDGLSGHACEDLITIGTPGSDNITIKNSWMKANPKKSSWDKTLQNDFGSRVNIENNDFVGGKMCVRFKPNTQGSVIGNRFWNCEVALRATSDDPSLPQMSKGPVRVLYKSNKCNSCGSEIKTSGDQVYIER